MDAWHISKPKKNPYQSAQVYCNRPLGDVAPYILDISGVVDHVSKITVCRECWENATDGILLGDESINKENKVKKYSFLCMGRDGYWIFENRVYLCDGKKLFGALSDGDKKANCIAITSSGDTASLVVKALNNYDEEV